MNKALPWWVLIIIGVVLLLINFLIQGAILGVVGDICLLIGIVNGIVAAVQHFKKK